MPVFDHCFFAATVLTGMLACETLPQQTPLCTAHRFQTGIAVAATHMLYCCFLMRS